MKITLNHPHNAPNFCFKVLAEDGRSVFVQTDWEYPSIASSFGWSVRNVQKCKNCRKVIIVPSLDELPNDATRRIPTSFCCDECQFNADDWKKDTGTEYPHIFP